MFGITIKIIEERADKRERERESRTWNESARWKNFRYSETGEERGGKSDLDSRTCRSEPGHEGMQQRQNGARSVYFIPWGAPAARVNSVSRNVTPAVPNSKKRIRLADDCRRDCREIEIVRPARDAGKLPRVSRRIK